MSNLILVVEDDPLDIELVRIAIERCELPHEVAFARDGEEAINFLLCADTFSSRTRENPAAILLDLKLPKLNGLEVLATIRRIPHLASIPVIILSASGEEKDLNTAQELGISSYIVKPLEWRGFSEKLCQAMEAKAS
ncbi:response regulator [Noviherbaspirillum sp. CPCC 100848]|uniref:Response regulator n=1 Tax=Noviherbaspirillum album TaxID=3080276 RepID=A0ABU6JC14_9BURK|nr:response regulator [Noviherbaspirillum sp. CPCC 100848]MEC4721193.1 response regulator [Noviherbaspirillum sp. CPCC 100848]